MSYERFNEVEKYFKDKKNRTPSGLKLARTHVLMLIKELSEEELKNAKIFYQSQLSTSSMIGNYLTIMAIIVSLLACLISLLASSENSQQPQFKYIVAFLIFIVLIYGILVSKMHQQLKTKSQQCETYTIIIKLIDEVLEK